MWRDNRSESSDDDPRHRHNNRRSSSSSRSRSPRRPDPEPQRNQGPENQFPNHDNMDGGQGEGPPPYGFDQLMSL